MKPNMIVGALALTSVFMAGHLQAADGTVHFRGEIIDSTCEVTPETKDQVVDLGKVNRLQPLVASMMWLPRRLFLSI